MAGNTICDICSSSLPILYVLNAGYKSKMRNVNQIKGYGTRKVGDDGKYCFDIKWNRGFEDVSGCRRMY